MFTELWIDDHKSRVLKDYYIDELQRLGFSGISVMANRAVRPYDLTWRIRDIEKLNEMCRKRDIETAITLWIPPSRKRIADLTDNYIKPLYDSGISAVEFDLEHLWKEKRCVGYRNLREAALDLVWKLEEQSDVYHDVRVDVTTHPWHREVTDRNTMMRYADRLYLQAYGTNRSIKGDPVRWARGPAYMQSFALGRSQAVPEHVKLCLGLPTWGQTWKGHTPHEAMQKAYDTCVAASIPIVRYWSSKFVLGSRKNKYAYRFFENLNK